MKPPEYDLAVPRIAVVEDDECLAMLLRYNLEASGMAVDCIIDGVKALGIIRDCAPDAVVLDWELPKLSGIEILRQLRGAAVTQNMPVLMLTARTEPVDRHRALALGADAFFCKPFSIVEVMACLRQLLGRPRALIGETRPLGCPHEPPPL